MRMTLPSSCSESWRCWLAIRAGHGLLALCATGHHALGDLPRPATARKPPAATSTLQNGCVYCHSQAIRPFDWDLALRAHRPRPGTMWRTNPIQLGSQRTGVDLSQEGGEHPDDWHHAHFINPRYTRPSSVMPPFEWLGTERIRALTRVCAEPGVSCRPTAAWSARIIGSQESITALRGRTGMPNVRWGGGARPRRLAPGAHYRPPPPALQRGAAHLPVICIALHGPVGDGMRGRPQPWIYPPPLNFTILKGRGDLGPASLYHQINERYHRYGHALFQAATWNHRKSGKWGITSPTYFINQSDANQEPKGIDAAWEP